jgi:y4mF family transcriptional regulator
MLHLSMSAFLKTLRKTGGFTQEDLAKRAGVALTVVRKMEQGKTDLQLEKVNRVLAVFGHSMAPVKTNQITDEPLKFSIAPPSQW